MVVTVGRGASSVITTSIGSGVAVVVVVVVTAREEEGCGVVNVEDGCAATQCERAPASVVLLSLAFCKSRQHLEQQPPVAPFPCGQQHNGEKRKQGV